MAISRQLEVGAVRCCLTLLAHGVVFGAQRGQGSSTSHGSVTARVEASLVHLLLGP